MPQQAHRPEYPYLVIRLMSGVYQREQIEVRSGPAAASIRYNTSFVSYREPFTAGGDLSQACQDLLVAAALDAVRRSRLRMCLVWGKQRCTFVEADGRTRSVMRGPEVEIGL